MDSGCPENGYFYSKCWDVIWHNWNSALSEKKITIFTALFGNKIIEPQKVPTRKNKWLNVKCMASIKG